MQGRSNSAPLGGRRIGAEPHEARETRRGADDRRLVRRSMRPDARSDVWPSCRLAATTPTTPCRPPSRLASPPDPWRFCRRLPTAGAATKAYLLDPPIAEIGTGACL